MATYIYAIKKGSGPHMQYINIGMRGRDMHAVPIDGTRDNAYIMHGEVRHTLYTPDEFSVAPVIMKRC